MKKIIYLLMFFSFQFFLQGQEKTSVYLFFDLKNEEMCKIPKVERGRYHSMRKAKKI